MKPAHNAMVRNILNVYSQATQDEILRGSQLYPLAHSIVVEWAEHHQRSIANVASIIAALSPQLPWERTLIIADDVLHGNVPSIGGVLHANLRKAEQIRDENLTNTLSVFKQGPKVACFSVNLAGDWNIVTVDTHAGQIACGDMLSSPRLGRWREYVPFADAYVDAARRVDLLPATLQAITWVTWKRLYPTIQKIRQRSRW